MGKAEHHNGPAGLLGVCKLLLGLCPRLRGHCVPHDGATQSRKARTQEGSTTKVKWTAEADLAFVASKEAFSPDFSLQTVNPDLPCVPRADASGKAIGAVLEQIPAAFNIEATIKEQIRAGTTVPVAFLSRKLTDSQDRS